MKIITGLVALLLCFSLCQCRTPQEAAQRHLRKAIALDPTIIGKQSMDTTISDTARGIVDVTTPAKTVETPGINVDSLLTVLDDLKKAGKTPEAYLYKDSTIAISVKKDKNGNLSAKVDMPPQIIKVPVKVPYKITVTVPGKTITVREWRPFYHYWQFWLSVVISLLLCYLMLTQRFPNLQIRVLGDSSPKKTT